MKNLCKNFLFSTLIGILLLSCIGCTQIEIYNNANEIINNNNDAIDNLMIEAFNNQFMTYMGENKKSTAVKGLIQKIILNNMQENSIISLTLNDDVYTSSPEELRQMETNLSNESKYTVSIKEYSNEGKISKILITELYEENSNEDSYLNIDDKGIKSLIPQNATANTLIDLGKIKLENNIYNVKCLKSDDNEYIIKFFENTEEIKSLYLRENIHIFKNKYIINLDLSDEGNSLTTFSIYDSKLNFVERFNRDSLYEFIIEDEKIYFSNNVNDYVEGISDVDKYYRVDYELKEDNGKFSANILKKDYENVIGPAGQS